MQEENYFPSLEDYPLTPLTLADKNIFEKALDSLSEPLSDHSFANIYLWKDASHLTWSKIHNHLCVFTNGTDLTLFLPPLPISEATSGEFKQCMDVCFRIMDNYHIPNCIDYSKGKIRYASEEMIRQIISQEGGDFGDKFLIEKMSGDYIYDKKDMVNLVGGKYKKKRQSKQKFMRLYPNHREEALNDNHITDCLKLLDIWQEYADVNKKTQVTEDKEACQTSYLRSMEKHACQQALINHSILGLRGMVVYVGGVLTGFTLGEKIGESQASILFEKTHPDYDGCPQFIYSEFCRLFWDDCKEINAGDDWSIPTLRLTKESYHPIRRLNKYVLERKSEGIIIRKAHPDDLDRLVEIEKLCFNSDIGLTREKIYRLIINPNVVNLVACYDGRVIGSATSFSRRSKNNLSGRIYNLAVDPDYRSKGIGRKLLNFLIRRFELLRYSRIYLEVDEFNDKAIQIYHSIGFKEYRKLHDYYGKGKNGKSMCLEIKRN